MTEEPGGGKREWTDHALTIRLSGDAMDALWRVHREDFPGATLEALGAKLIRDELVRMGVLALPAANRSKGARRG